MTPPEAIQLAKQFVREAYPEQELKQLLLEEIKFEEERGRWLVTIGYDSLLKPHYAPAEGIMRALQTHRPDREYKVVEVDDASETVKAMTIREFAGT